MKFAKADNFTGWGIKFPSVDCLLRRSGPNHKVGHFRPDNGIIGPQGPKTMSNTLSPAPLAREAFRIRLALIAIFGLVAFGALLAVPPFPQDPAYHDFADQRTLLQIPHALNVLSNTPFVIFGVLSLAWLLSSEGRKSEARFLCAWEWWAFLILFVFVALTGFGSAYYHWNPSNATLYWDRLPLTVVFMTFFVLVVAERVAPVAGLWLLGPCVAFGVFGVTYWHWTEMQSVGDVRIYALVQFLPLLALPLVLLLFPARYTGTAVLWGILAVYALAKLLELLDRVIYVNNGVVSGHTLKHLVASLGALGVLLMLKRRRPLGLGADLTSPRK